MDTLCRDTGGHPGRWPCSDRIFCHPVSQTSGAGSGWVMTLQKHLQLNSFGGHTFIRLQLLTCTPESSTDTPTARSRGVFVWSSTVRFIPTAPEGIHGQRQGKNWGTRFIYGGGKGIRTNGLGAQGWHKGGARAGEPVGTLCGSD